MVRTGLLVVGVISAAALCARAAEADIRIAVAGDMTGALCLVRRAVSARRRAGGGGSQRQGRRARPKGRADRGRRLLRPRSGGGARPQAGERWRRVRRRALCSHSSIAAAKVYEKAKILMISPSSASAKLTDEGGPNVFRVCGRDDRQGTKVADYLADHWAGKEIAILDDGTAWGRASPTGSGAGCSERGVTVAVDETYHPRRSGVLRAGLEDAGRRASRSSSSAATTARRA